MAGETPALVPGQESPLPMMHSRMSQLFRSASVALLIAAGSLPTSAQQAAVVISSRNGAAIVPPLVNFNGALTDLNGKPISGVTGVTFALYKDEQGGAPLWLETQNVYPDKTGHYTVLLGSTTSTGLPAELFAAGEARWLGVQVQGQSEQPRILLASAPYALKAADAQTVGGLPASAFVLAAPPVSSAASATTSGSAVTSNATSATTSDVTTTGGTANTIPMFTTATNIQNSILTQTSTTAINVGGKLNLPALGTATSSAGFNSRPLDFVASVYNSSTSTAVPQTFQWQAEAVNNDKTTASGTMNLLYASGTATPAETGVTVSSGGLLTTHGLSLPTMGTASSTSTAGFTSQPLDLYASSWDTAGTPAAVSQHFRWQAEPAGSDTASPSGTMNLLYGSGTATPAETGLKISSKGLFTFASGQTFPVPNGEITDAMLADSSLTVTAGTDLTGGGKVSLGGSTTLNLDTTKVPQLVANNSFTGNQSVIGNIGVVDAVVGNTAINAVAAGSGATALSVQATDLGLTEPNTAINGLADGVGGTGVVGEADNGQSAVGVWGLSQNGVAGLFSGNVNVIGSLSNSGGSFKIDDPTDPANKYLYHSFVESPDMKNIYDGVATLDALGEAVVQLPDWFEALNRDFRYQLTCIGGFAPVYIAEKINQNHFKIAGGKAGLEVSWQVTGIRQDAWANAHRIPVEVEKPAQEQGYYIHPELFGQPAQKSIEWADRPQQMEKLVARDH